MNHCLLRCVSVCGAAVTAFAQGPLQFAPAVSYPVGHQPEGGLLFDADGDTDLDLAVTSEQPDKVQILANQGNGTFAAAFVLPTGSGTSPEGLACADFDGDGHLDLVMALFSANQIRLAFGDGHGQFALGPSYAAGSEPSMVVATDLDGDGWPDAAVNNRVSGDVSVYLNDGAGGLVSAGTYPVGLETRCVAAGDLTGDGFPELAVSARDSHRVRLFRNLGDGTFQTLIDLSLGSILEPQGVAIADFDHDGALDVATTSSGNSLQEHVSVFVQNNGNNHWVGPINGPTNGTSPRGLVAADFDLDGIVDVAAANADSNDVTTLRSSGIAGIFNPPTVHAVGDDPEALILLAGDLDGDTTPDIVSLNRGSDDVSVLLNLEAPLPAVYCTAKSTSNGCLPLMGSTGSPSLSAPAAFTLFASRLPVQKAGLIFFGLDGPHAAPFQGGFLCVHPPLHRLPVQDTGGIGGCQGTLVDSFADILAHPSAAAISAGSLVCCQAWFRDPQAATTTGLSDALMFEAVP